MKEFVLIYLITKNQYLKTIKVLQSHLFYKLFFM